jgi:hypothetical protein
MVMDGETMRLMGARMTEILEATKGMDEMSYLAFLDARQRQQEENDRWAAIANEGSRYTATTGNDNEDDGA